MGDEVRNWQNVFEKETTTLRRHPAFITPHTMFGFDEINVRNDVPLG